LERGKPLAERGLLGRKEAKAEGKGLEKGLKKDDKGV